MNKNTKIIFLLLFSIILTACATPAPVSENVVIESDDKVSNEVAETEIEAPGTIEASPFDKAPEEIRYGHFPQDILARVILAEMAGQRGSNEDALDGYLSLARDTGDLGIIKRASRIATYMRDVPAATEMTKLWLEQEPDSVEAYQTLAIQMLSISRYRDALDHLTSLLELSQPMDFRIISNRMESDPDAGIFRDAMIADLNDLALDYPENQSLRLALAHLYQQNRQTQEAYELIRQLSIELNDPTDVVLLEVELLESLDNEELARTRLQEGIEKHPEDVQLRFQYARNLVNQNNLEGAAEQFKSIVEIAPDDLDMLYSLALITIEMNHIEEAKAYFERLVQSGHRLNDTHYYLGYIHNQRNDIDEAIQHYMQVNTGTNFLQAQRDLTELLIKENRYPEAHQRLQRFRYTSPEYNQQLLSLEAGVLIDENYEEEALTLLSSALAAFPDNLQLLYLRSVISTNRNDLALMEQDLRQMISLNPDSPIAYNSLGYILADRTDRIEEAYELILKAVELAPSDPAIMDSLGWVQYRLGLYEEAKKSLENAFELFPDHEVAAHLGEVLWVMGEKRAANRVWQNALELQPDSEIIKEAMDRLTPESGR